MALQFFFTIHDETGKRIGDDSDYPLNLFELGNELARMEKVTIKGEEFYRAETGALCQIISEEI